MTRVLKDWRRWAAALCVGLIALISFDQAAGLDGCHAGTLPAIETVFDAMPAPSNNASDALAPQAHCCGAHAVGVGAVETGSLGVARSSQDVWPASAQFRAYDIAFALERPPRAVIAA
ncbi:MAG: hypothetical protein AB7J28_13480 [Hyphomonadaceae bacterium]